MGTTVLSLSRSVMAAESSAPHDGKTTLEITDYSVDHNTKLPSDLIILELQQFLNINFGISTAWTLLLILIIHSKVI